MKHSIIAILILSGVCFAAEQKPKSQPPVMPPIEKPKVLSPEAYEAKMKKEHPEMFNAPIPKPIEIEKDENGIVKNVVQPETIKQQEIPKHPTKTIIKSGDSNIQSDWKAIEQLPQLEQKGSKKSYEKLIEMLQTKESSKAQKVQEDLEAKEAKIEAEKKAIEQKQKDEEIEMLLPIPLGYLIIDKQILVYAEYREKKLAKDAKPKSNATQSQVAPLAQTNPLLSQNQAPALGITYDLKRINIKEKDVFGNWVVKSLTPSYVEYANKKDQSKTIKKYY